MRGVFVCRQVTVELGKWGRLFGHIGQGLLLFWARPVFIVQTLPIHYGSHTTESPFWRARSAPPNQTLPRSADHLAQKHHRLSPETPKTNTAGGMGRQAKRLKGGFFTERMGLRYRALSYRYTSLSIRSNCYYSPYEPVSHRLSLYLYATIE